MKKVFQKAPHIKQKIFKLFRYLKGFFFFCSTEHNKLITKVKTNSFVQNVEAFLK